MECVGGRTMKNAIALGRNKRTRKCSSSVKWLRKNLFSQRWTPEASSKQKTCLHMIKVYPTRMAGRKNPKSSLTKSRTTLNYSICRRLAMVLISQNKLEEKSINSTMWCQRTCKRPIVACKHLRKALSGVTQPMCQSHLLTLITRRASSVHLMNTLICSVWPSHYSTDLILLGKLPVQSRWIETSRTSAGSTIRLRAMSLTCVWQKSRNNVARTLEKSRKWRTRSAKPVCQPHAPGTAWTFDLTMWLSTNSINERINVKLRFNYY